MTGDEIKALLASLGLGARQLGAKLGVDAATVQAWTREEQFPTKRHVDAMRALQSHRSKEEEDGEAGDGNSERGEPLFEALADPAMWTLLRKVLAYPKLRQEVEKAAAKYRDPAGKDAERRKT